MLPRTVRHYICPSCRSGRAASIGGSDALIISTTPHTRVSPSGDMRYLRTRTRAQNDLRKAEKPIPKTLQDPEKFTLSPRQKDVLTTYNTFRDAARQTLQKDTDEVSSAVQGTTIERVVELMKIKGSSKGLKRVASKLTSIYAGRPYEEVDNELETVMAFRSGSNPLSPTTEGLLTKLGFIETSAKSTFTSPDILSSSTPQEMPIPEVTSATETTLEHKEKSEPSVPSAPVPEQLSIAIETPDNFLDIEPERRLVGKSQAKKQATRSLSTPGRWRRIAKRLNTDRGIGNKGSREIAKPGNAKPELKIADMIGNRVQVARGAAMPLTPMSVETSEVPRLSHDLSRVLFNPGVYQLQDPRSRVWNFDPYLGNLMPVSQFNYDALNKYITSSEDVQLREMAQSRGKRYIGSTSSMSGALAHFHFLLSAFRDLNMTNLSRGFIDEGNAGFTKIQKGPSAIFLRYKDGVYAVDADKEFDSANILMSLGRSMEKLLTSDKEEFERFRKTEDAAKDAEVKSTNPEAYHYSGLGQFLLRSQLDAYDPRLPGTGMFDLKTRAVAAVRMLMRDHEKGVGYQIKERFGTWESYEREYFDMMRSAFLKYSLQVRMGRMDGIFVAFHNTERLFGFQYVPISEMDFALHGQSDRVLGDQEFSLSIQLLNYVFNEATMQHPGQSLRFHFEARPATTASPQFMYIFAEPVTEEEIVAIQNLKKDEIRAFEERMHNPGPKEGSESYNENEEDNVESGDTSAVSLSQSGSTSATHQSNAANVQFLDSILGMDLNEAMGSKSEEEVLSGLGSKPAGNDEASLNALDKPLSAWKLHIRNIVNGQAVVRPDKLEGRDTWGLQYTLTPLAPSEARRNYNLCKNRRKSTLEAPQDADATASFYLSRLISMSEKGAAWRQRLDKLDAERERVVLYEE